MEKMYIRLQLIAENNAILARETADLKRFSKLFKQVLYRIEGVHGDTFLIYIPLDKYAAAQLINAVTAYCFHHRILHALGSGKISLGLVEV